MKPYMSFAALACVALASPLARAADTMTVSIPRLPDIPYFESGKLLATGGVSNVEGAGGGGISTWAPITGYGTKDGVGGNAHFT